MDNTIFRKVHILKCWTTPFQAMRDGIKTFEFRKNDRDYHVGEILELHEWNPDTDYTGEVDSYKVTWCLYEGFGLPDGYCIMSVVPITNDNQELKNRDVCMTDYVISEERMERTCLCTICRIADNLCDEIRMNTISEHDTQIRQEERNKVLDELTCLIRDAKESWWSQRRIEVFHYTGLYSMIESLRKNVENDDIKNDNIESDDYDDQEGVNL